MKHSPGPWYTFQTNPDFPLTTLFDANDCEIATVELGPKESGAGSNANLIAAAPEMLAILQAMLVPNADVREVYARIEAVLVKVK